MKRYITSITAVLSCLGLGGLLAGFTPGPAPLMPEWRGKITENRAYARVPLSRLEDDFTRHAHPGTRLLAINRQELTAPPKASMAPMAMLRFDDASVSILTALGLRSLDSPVTASGPYSLSAVSPELFATAALSGNDSGLSGTVSLSENLLLRSDLSYMLPQGPVCAVTVDPATALSKGDFSLQPLGLRVTRYQAMVERYAAQYNLDVPLVLAVIQTESGFNPYLISSRNAHGLMQVVPATAGGEVHRWLGRSGVPTSTELLNPETNIRYGMAYMHLLRSKHLDGIRNPQSLEYCVIAAYNGGSGAVLRHFGSNKGAAIAAINALSPQEVLTRLTYSFPARETRFFVRKVLASRRQYMMFASN